MKKNVATLFLLNVENKTKQTLSLCKWEVLAEIVIKKNDFFWYNDPCAFAPSVIMSLRDI